MKHTLRVLSAGSLPRAVLAHPSFPFFLALLKEANQVVLRFHVHCRSKTVSLCVLTEREGYLF